MYEPKQIPYLLNKAFRKQIDYREYHVSELKNYCVCFWHMKSKHTITETIYNPILPDACIDIVIDFSNQTINFAGFSKKTELLALHGDIDYLGIRFRPGAFFSIFSTESDKIMDQLVAFSEIEKELKMEILSIDDIHHQIEILKDYLMQKIKQNPDTTFIRLVNELYQNPNEQHVIDIACRLGYGKRQLSRIFKIHYGVSPKVLLNILRLHLCLTLLLEEKKKLLDIAILCGFYDQSHFIKELKKYTGISPIQLLESYHL